MKLIINGKPDEVPDGLTIKDLLLRQGVKTPEMVSVEHNGIILSRNNIQTVIVRENDIVEFIFFMGGGRSL